MDGPDRCDAPRGETLRAHRVGGLATLYVSAHPEGEIPPHFHESLRVCLVVEGEYDEWYGRERVRCRAGTMLVHAPGIVHGNRVRGTGARCFQISVHTPLPGGSPSEGRIGTSGSMMGPPVAPILDLWDAFRHSDPEDLLHLEQGVAGVLRALGAGPTARIGVTRFPWLTRVIEHLRGDPRPTPTLEELAELAGVSRSHLAAAFKARVGCTVGHFLRNVRTRKAAALLADSEAPMARVAVAAGFADQPHMIRTFKRHVGMTPGTFRRRFRSP